VLRDARAASSGEEGSALGIGNTELALSGFVARGRGYSLRMSESTPPIISDPPVEPRPGDVPEPPDPSEPWTEPEPPEPPSPHPSPEDEPQAA
jgi:hypothetical protein